MKNTRKNVWIALLCMAVLSGCSSSASDSAATSTTESAASATESASKTAVGSSALPEKAIYSDADLATDWSGENPVKIALNGKSATIDGSGAEVKDGTVTITKAGTYVVSGKLEDGQIVVHVAKEDKVHLVLNGAEIKNADGSAIDIKEAEKVILTLQDGTKNIVTDGATYANADADASEDAPNAAIFSKADLTVNGTGFLTVNGNYKDGLSSKDDLKMVSGSIEVNAVDDGVLGRDLVAVKEGTLNVKAGGDGIKSTNDTEEGKGNIAIEGGTFLLDSGSDGLQAAASVRVDGGSFDIVTNGGSANGKVHVEEKFGKGMGQPGQPANQAGTQQTQQAQTSETAETESSSAKALKATAHIAVTGGTFKIDSADDAVHSNDAVTISGGEVKIASGDDGIHANAALTIEGGKIDITKSYEGIEGKVITFAGGDVHVVTDDDGVNVSGGNDGSSTNGRPGQNEFAAAGDSMLVIKGGNLTVDAKGDGLDSNGSIEMSGGTVVVNGPTENMNGALDYNGTFTLTGGSLAAAGSAGMAQAPSEDSSQKSIHMSFPAAQKAGTPVLLKDEDGKTIATVTPTKSYQTLVLSSPDLKEGATYTLYSGDSKVVEFSISKSVTWLYESGETEAGAGQRGPGGGGGRGRGMAPPPQPASGQ